MLLADQLDLAEKMLLIGVTIPVAIGFGWRLCKNWNSENLALRRILTAIVLVAFASTVYIGYWSVWRLEVAANGTGSAYALHLLTIAPYITTPVAILTMIGYSFHIHAWVIKPLGNSWWVYLIAYACLVWLSGFFLVHTGPDATLANRLDTAEQLGRAAFALPTAVIYSFRLHKNWSSDNAGFKVMLCGIVLVSLGVAGHSLAWTTIIILDPTRLIEVNAFFTTPPVVAIVLGYSFHIYSWISRPDKLGHYWWSFILFYISALWMFGFYISPILKAISE